MNRSEPRGDDIGHDLDLTPSGEGSRIRLRVRPGARKDAILGTLGGALKVSVSAPPERGRANAAVLGLLAGALGVPAPALTLVSGHSSRDKVVLVPLAPAVVVERLQGHSGFSYNSFMNEL